MKKRMKVGLVGASGRMGQEITKILKGTPSFELHLAICRQSSLAEFAYTRAQPSCLEAKEVDLWIDFSSPELLQKTLSVAIKNKTPFVSGTTGLDTKQVSALKRAAKSIPILWASNMSLGVAVLTEAMKVFARVRQFDFQIEEFHHRRKKDSPSGTAKSLQQALENVVGRELPPPLSVRGGGIFGIHKVHAMAEDEHIIFEHSALNRAVFANGAVEAAKWLSLKKKGFYGMRDVLYSETK